MLLLTRRINETIVIGDDVDVTVLAVNGNQVRLGINAPKSISVHRKEIWLKIKDEEGALLNVPRSRKGFIGGLLTHVRSRKIPAQVAA